MPRNSYWFLGYRTKSEAQKAFQVYLNSLPRYVEFVDYKLIALFWKQHYKCKHDPFALPSKFILKDNSRGSASWELWAYFPYYGKWVDISYRSCFGTRTFETVAKNYFRELIEFSHRQVLDLYPKCQLCKKARSEEVHHVKPTFAEISKQVLDLISPEEKQSIWERTKLFVEFAISQDHPAIKHLYKAQNSAKLMAVCHSCHQDLEAQSRKAA